MGRKHRRKVVGERQREHRRHGCWDHLIVAPLWVAYTANLGTMLRTCDAIGACMAVPATPHYRKALDRGDTLPRRPHLHWVKGDRVRWVEHQRDHGRRILVVEDTADAKPLTLLEPVDTATVILLGHEGVGVPDEMVAQADEVVRIPMIGAGASLNVAVAGSLVAYRLAGLA